MPLFYNEDDRVKKCTHDNEQIKKIIYNGKVVFSSGIALNDSRYKMENLYSDTYSTDVKFPTDEFEIDELTTMNSMFNGCEQVSSLDLTNLDTGNIKDMAYMFMDCSNLTHLDLNFDMKNCTAVGDMFHGCENIASGNIHFYNFHSTYIGYKKDFFELVRGETGSAELEKLITVDFIEGPYDIYSEGGYVCNIRRRPYDDHDENDTWGRFEGTLDASMFIFSGMDSFWRLFADCTCHKIINMNTVDTSQVTSLHQAFAYCEYLETIDMKGFRTDNVENMCGVFLECYSLKELDLSEWDTSKVTDMEDMFNDCYELKRLDLSNFNTSNVTNMGNMFYNGGEETIDVSSFDTSNVTNMCGMFGGCQNLTSLDVSNFDTQNVTHMGNMFYGCSKLTSLDVSNFDTSNVTKMSFMFQDCVNITFLDLSNFNTEKVTDMSWMFDGCDKLVSIDISNFKTDKVQNMQEMFRNCSSLTEIRGVLDMKSITSKYRMSEMFKNCPNVTGVRIKNPPAEFTHHDEKTGLNEAGLRADQYEIVE